MAETEQQVTNLDKEIWEQDLLKGLSEDKRREIGENARRGFEEDFRSRESWEMQAKEWIDLATQIREDRNYPWPNASNVKYPLLTTAAMQFSARAYPSLVPSDGQVVKAIVIGKDQTGEKLDRAKRVSKYMSYQVMHEMENWEEEMDKLLMMNSIIGVLFKKTFYDKSADKIISRVVQPRNLVVNYWTRSLDDCERISEILLLSPRVLKERQLQGIYADVDLSTPAIPLSIYDTDNQPPPGNDETTPYELIEQHTFLDHDNSGYPKPVIITFERRSGVLLSIENRYRGEDVQTDEKGKIVKIKPWQCYTKFGFIPNPDGSFYDIGFGVLLGPLNESVNTLINQLVDAGSLSNLQSGYIGKGLRLRQGDTVFKPGEWKTVNAVGDDLKKQILPLPSKEPSKVLFELMGTLITSGKELASVAEIFTGKMPGQNTPATTTMATVEQGMKVFTAVYKRIYRALNEEFQKIYYLNGVYLDPNKYVDIIDETVGPDDFNNDGHDILPGADPNAVSQQEKLMKAQALLEIVQMMPGLLDPIEVVSRILEAQEQPDWQKLFTQQVQQTGQMPPPPPDPKLMAIQMKAQADQAKTAKDLEATQQKMELEGRDKMMQMQMKQQEHAQEMQHKAEVANIEAQSKAQMANIFAATEQAKGAQTLQQNQEAHQQKMQQTKESNKLTAQKSQQKKSSTGKQTK